jgi:flagellar basal-body rod modification protein FlgD
MTLLTTQLKNQDPLNPMDNAQMTSQLAQISTVDGISKLNTTLSKLIDSQSQTQTLQSASLVGHGVLVAGSNLTLQNGSGIGGFELTGAADNVSVQIKDANGIVVRTLSDSGMAAGVYPFTWDGKTDSGAQAVDGQYSISVTATQGANKVTVNNLQYGTVNSVAGTGTGISANLGTLGQFGMSDIKQIL